MARGRKSGPSRMDLRREAEAVEARERDDQSEDDTEELEDDELEDDEEGDDEGEGEGDDEEAVAEDEDGEPIAKPKAKAKAKKKAEPKKPAAKRTRAAKVVRMRAIWVVFDNATKRVDTFPFNKKADAEALLAKKLEEKKGGFYLQLVKEQFDS